MTIDRHSRTDGGPTIGAVAIMRDEAMNLPGFLACLRQWVSEIVIVDDRSTDQGPAIARAEGPHVTLIRHDMDQGEGFAGLRNAGIAAARSDWLLHLDCDERTSPQFARELAAMVADPSLNGIRYRRRNYFLHRPMDHGGWGDWNRPQIARRGSHRFVGALHETCEIDGGAEAIGQMRTLMAHLNDEDFDKRMRKSAQYVAMEAERMTLAGEAPTGASIFRRSVTEFLKKYVAKGGFRDGTPGLVAAMHSATATFRANALVWDRRNRIPRAELEEDLARAWLGLAIDDPDGQLP